MTPLERHYITESLMKIYEQLCDLEFYKNGSIELVRNRVDELRKAVEKED